MLDLTGKVSSVHKIAGEDILSYFHSCDSPIEAIVRLGREHLVWLVSLLFCAPDGSGDPLVLMPFQGVMLDILWHKKFPMILACRGAGKTFMLAVYALLRAMLIPAEEIVIVGKAFRQSKKVFEYLEKLYYNSPLVQEALKTGLKKAGGKAGDHPIRRGTDRYEMTVGLSKIIALPVGDGESIRGQRATVLMADEFASINEEILEIVITPFLSVHKNPQKRAAMTSMLRRLEKLGADDDLLDMIITAQGRGNQMVISGTASSPFNHFYKYYQQYLGVINSQGDSRAIRQAMAQTSQGAVDAIPQDIIESVSRSWKEYALYRVPYTSMPEGALDESMVARNRLMFTAARFRQEYLCEFPDETGGFIPYSIIKAATPDGPEAIPVELFGVPRARYVAGIDPARNQDYFAVVILKVYGGRASLVYAYAWQKTEYHKIIPHLQELFLRRFSVSRIAIDKGGGGDHIQDALCDLRNVQREEDLIWAFDDDKGKFKKGHRLLEMVNFTNTWKDEAINAMKSDIEHKRLLFPTANVGLSEHEIINQYLQHHEKKPNDMSQTALNQMAEDLMIELHGEENDFQRISDGVMQHINEAINETCAIERISIPGSAAVKYDLPKMPEAANDVRHRDRFTALMLASYAARHELGLDQAMHPSYISHGTTPQRMPTRRAPKISSFRRGGVRVVNYGTRFKRGNWRPEK